MDITKYVIWRDAKFEKVPNVKFCYLIIDLYVILNNNASQDTTFNAESKLFVTP